MSRGRRISSSSRAVETVPVCCVPPGSKSALLHARKDETRLWLFSAFFPPPLFPGTRDETKRDEHPFRSSTLFTRTLIDDNVNIDFWQTSFGDKPDGIGRWKCTGTYRWCTSRFTRSRRSRACIFYINQNEMCLIRDQSVQIAVFDIRPKCSNCWHPHPSNKKRGVGPQGLTPSRTC